MRLARDGCKEGPRRDSTQVNGLGAAASLDGAASADTGAQPARLPNLFFSAACTQTIADADMILISVNTPTKRRGVGAGRATDMTAIEGAVRDVATYARPGTILVEKSTVPCKTGQLIKDIVSSLDGHFCRMQGADK